MLPLIIPSIILGASLLSFFRQFLDIELTLWTVGSAHVLISIPFSMLVLIARLEGFDRNLEEASYDLGMSTWQTLRRVTLPLAMPGVLASLLLCFLVSFDEFLLAFFLSGNQPTLPVYMYSLLRFPQFLPGVLALGSCILVASAVLVSIAEWLRRGKDKA
jgi:spermidine/putrescine transport system permease protein